MPSSVCVCDCTHRGKSARFYIEIDNYTNSIGTLCSKIAGTLKCTVDELDVIYCGEKLMKEDTLESYNITPQSTVFAFRRGSENVQTDFTDSPSVHEVLHTLQKALQNPAYRKTVDQLLTTQGAMQRMMSSVSGLANDPVALSILQDPELLSILAHRQNIHKVLKAHPSFGKAALYVAAVVEEERARDGSRPIRSAVYSLDQMSDEEEDRHQGGASSGGPQQPITASQLAAALAAATASASSASLPSPSPGAVQSSVSAGTSGPVVISPDFFQQAMVQAQNAALDAQLQQLRDMGITDENIARQALNATGGDLQAALEFILDNSSSHT